MTFHTSEVHEPGVDIELKLHDFYPITGFFPSEGSLVEEFASHHSESSGRAIGTATIDGATTRVDAPYHATTLGGPARRRPC